MPRATFITGATTVLGYAIARTGQAVPCCGPHAGYPVTRGWLRVAAESPEDWRRLFAERRVDTLIHAAGVCDVGRCERDPAFAWAVNVGGVESMLAALPTHTRLVYLSSDHVFGGRDAPYREDEPPHPISAYGRTRVAAECAVLAHREEHLVIRVGLPLGPSASGRTGHVDWLRHRTRQGLPMTVIAGEFRSAIWADAAAQIVLELARTDAAGVRHLAAPAVGRPELARYLVDAMGLSTRFRVRDRSELELPHLGRVELATDDPQAMLGDPMRRGAVVGRPGSLREAAG